MLIAHPVKGKRKSEYLCAAFIEGAPKEAKGHVFCGVIETNCQAWYNIQKTNEPWYYIDNSYFDSVRGSQFRVTKNSVQLNPLFKKSNGERFKRLNLEIKPWREMYESRYILVCPQSESFMKVVARDHMWLSKKMSFIHGTQGKDSLPMRMRPWLRDKLKQQSTLENELKYAYAVVTHSSAAAVTAALNGVAISVSNMSSLYALNHRPFSSDTHTHVDRIDIFNVLADNQFTYDEMKSGSAWRNMYP